MAKMTAKLLVYFCLAGLGCCRMVTRQEPIKCMMYDENTGSVKSEPCQGEEADSKKPVEYFCHTVWSNVTSSDHPSGMRVLRQQCLSNLGDAHRVCRDKTSCVDDTEGRAGQQEEGQDNTRILHCCCSTDNCNQEFSWSPPEVRAQNSTEPVLASQPLSTWFLLLYTLVPLFVLVVVGGALCYVYHHRKHSEFQLTASEDSQQPPSPPTPTLACRPVQLLEIKARGRFGAVWKGQLGKDMVAVKIFPLQDKQSWFAEQEIYNLPQMNHDNILKFLGVERRGENLQLEFWLVSSFHENGSLCDFLKSNILSWDEIVKISLSMARGLAHLHGEIPSNKGSGIKPAIAHRDFKSKNVLIKSDLTACIGDFGLALVFRPNEVVGDTHGQVGTRRYMAPEVLEGAINFSRDAFLRIDMYACGLVLWEIATRCNLLETPTEYKLPFEAEASPHPSLEEISDLVVTRKVRPELKKQWRNHPGFSVLSETIEECWDHDAEARLSASCVVERLQLVRQVMAETVSSNTQEFINNQINLTANTNCEQMRLIPINSSQEESFG